MRPTRLRSAQAAPRRSLLPAVPLIGLCGLFALSGSILEAEQPAAPKSATPVKFRVTVPKETVDVNGFVFEGGAFNPSYSPPPQPRSMPTAMTINGAATYTSPEPQAATISPSQVEAAANVPSPAPKRRAVVEEPEPREQANPPSRPHLRATPEERETPSSRVRGTHPKSETEPEGERPHARHHEAPAAPEAHHPRPSDDGKSYAGGKSEKPLLQLEEESPWHFTGSAGYYSRYMFRGLDVGYRTGIDDGNDSAFFGASAAAAYKDFAVGFWFLESLDPYVQRGSAFNDDFGRRNKDLTFRSAPKERYKEYDLFANYTFHITDTLALTTGMNFYFFGDDRSWANSGEGVSNTMETAVALTYTGLPWINQSLSYYYDFDAFKGSYLEYKASAKPIRIFQEGSFSISLVPSVTVSYDFRYNGTNNGWNAIEPGLDVPIQITDGLVLNLGARYNKDLGSSSGNGNGGFADRTDDRFWFSAAIQYSFPNRGWSAARSLSDYSRDKDGKDMKDKVVVPPPDYKWDIQVGAGVRSISSDFHLRSTGLGRYADRMSLGGDTRLATAARDGNYADGSVFSDSDPFGDGTSTFSFRKQSQLITPPRGDNRQVQYHSERFLADDMSSKSSNHNDDDEPVFPYITLSRELLKKENFSLSAGVGYQYARSETDSGYRLTGAAKNSAYTFTYDVDEFFSDPNNPQAPFNNKFSRGLTPGSDYYLIYNPQQYQNTYQGNTAFGSPAVPLAPPQRDVQTGTRSLAAFKRAELDADLHSISIPIKFTYDLTPRVHLGISAGATFNIFDLDLKTDTYVQLIEEDRTAPQVERHQSPYSTATGQPINIAGPGKPAGGIGVTSSRNGVNQGQQQPIANAKGAQGAKSRNLPGENVAHNTSRHSGQEFKLGVFGQASLDIDLDAAKRWYVEVFARYDYVPEFSFSDGSSSTVIDASSLGGGVGLGFRF